MSSTPLTETANQLTELVARARALSRRARRERRMAELFQCRAIADQLDAARVQLIAAGPRGLDAAAAFVGAGSAQLARILEVLDVEDPSIDRSALDRVSARDVVAWLDVQGIRLSSRQRQAIEQR